MIQQELFKQMRKNHLLPLGILYLALRIAVALMFRIYPVMAKHTSAYESGASVFLIRQTADWLLIALTAYCCVCVWVKEFSAEMQGFHLTARRGRVFLVCVKYMLVLVFPALLSITASGAEYAIDLFRFGQADISLSAIGYDYQSATRNGSIFQYALLLIPFKAIGISSFAALVSLLALLIKKTLPVLLSALALLLVPVYLFPSPDLRCRLCLPVSLLQGSELWRGSVTFPNMFGGTEYVFREITEQELLRNLLVQLLLIAFCLYLCIRLYLQKPFRVRHFVKAVPVILSAFLLTGCGMTLPDAGAPRFLLCTDGSTIYSKADQSMFSVNPTPLTSYRVAGIYGDCALVTEQVSDAAAFRVSLLHLPDLTKSDQMTVGRSVNTDGLLGLDDLVEVPAEWIFDYKTYGLSQQLKLEGSTLYGKAEDALISFDLENGTRKEWLNGIQFSAPQIRDGDLYYLDEARTLCRITEDGNVDSLVQSVSDYKLCQHSICYIADGRTFRLSEHGGTQQVCDAAADYFLYCDEMHIVFVTANGETIAISGDTLTRFDKVFYAADDSNLYREEGVVQAVAY